jgi:glycosyltransferase involved in cell wall biosynthesis
VSDRTGPARGDEFQILTIGQVNPNKRVASVIQAIGNSPLLRDHTSYRLVGHVQPEAMNELSALAERCGVKLIISGAVDDLTLAHAVDESDVISCLRWPTLEAASASAIEAMLYGKPAIVTNAGFYKEIPDSCALKVSVENELSDLQSALELLFRDQSQRKAVAASGQQWTRKVFTAENYAWELVKTVEATLKARPILNAIDYFCSVMHQWSANPDMLRHEDIARPLYLFEERGSIDPSDAD